MPPPPGFSRAEQRIDPARIIGQSKSGLPIVKAARPAKPKPYVTATLDWYVEPGELPGKASVVGMAVWFLRSVTKKSTVRLTSGTLTKFRVTRKAAYRALEELEAAGLVKVTRRHGRGPEVTILDVAPSATGQPM